MDPKLLAWNIDYEQILAESKPDRDSLVSFLMKELPGAWRDKYEALTPHEVNVLRVPEHGFTYIYDWYSQFEAEGVQYDPKIEDRLVGALGISRLSATKRDVKRQRSWVGPTQKRFGIDRNKGHFIANAVGGGLELNVF